MDATNELSLIEIPTALQRRRLKLFVECVVV